MLDVNSIEVNLPTTISAYVINNPDLSYTIVLNARLTRERRIQAYYHELYHIEHGHYEYNSVDIVELSAHSHDSIF